MNVSVLMSVYAGEQADYFEESLLSICEQSILPKQIVIVKDGFLTPELEKVLTNFKRAFEHKVKIDCVSLTQQVNLGPALNEGLRRCQCSLVARMDSDDHCLKNRFEIQLASYANYPEAKIIGGQIQEFDKSWDQVISYRKVPLAPSGICAFSRRRNPMNHMTILFEKDYVEKIGGYRNIPGFEDYDLWLRALKDSGKVLRNVPEVLVAARVKSLQNRRGGIKYLRKSFVAHQMFYREDLIDFRSLMVVLVGSIATICSPKWVRKAMYKKFLRRGKL
ncbi:glycosyltransferase [Lactiplantibacillus daoliensis]|uniref:Glycosyltransferase n=1 Tax=Lactiplantibacillus daoliensis TaxID=2559916 RepID=A0ABW1UG39_9LACO|nr:glycosyltransferase [Lactiplantibacillus daoliensis]